MYIYYDTFISMIQFTFPYGEIAMELKLILKCRVCCLFYYSCSHPIPM